MRLSLSAAWADVVNGRLEKVSGKTHEIVVSGVKVKMANDVTIILEDQARKGRHLLINNLSSYRGRTVYCKGRQDEKAGFIADFVKVYLWR